MATFGELIRMRSSPLNGSSTPPLKKNVTCAYFSVSEMRSCVLSFFAIHSPKVFAGWIRAWGFDIRCIFGQLDEINLRHFLTGETVEIAVDEGAGDFARAIGTEVHEDQRIAIFHGGIGGLQRGSRLPSQIRRFHHARKPLPPSTAVGNWNSPLPGQQIIGLLNAVPAVVAVHGIVTTNDGRHAAFAQCGKFVFKRFKRTFCAAWWRIATIRKACR